MSTNASCQPELADAGFPARPAVLRPDALWITWDSHRRTRELAAAMGVRLREILFSGPRPIRHFTAAVTTIVTLLRERPRLVFVQNPSVVLAALACTLKRALHCRVIVDRHSNFRFENTTSGLFNALSNYSLRAADLTIVTNEFVRNLVESKGGRAITLPDRIPTLALARRRTLPGRLNVLFVCTYSPDEPVHAVIEAARRLDHDVHVYITGNSRALASGLRKTAPRNVIFTGFLPPAEYESLMASVDIVLELTTRDHTLLCGAYEAVSLGKPLVISRTEALTRFFHRGSVATDNTSEGIAEALVSASTRVQSLRRDMTEFRHELDREWNAGFARLTERIRRLDTPTNAEPSE